MARFLGSLFVVVAVVAVCARRPTETPEKKSTIQRTFLREVMQKLTAMRSVNSGLTQDQIRLATGLAVMDLVQKCEVYLFTEDLDPMELVANYFFHQNHSGDSILDHACPVVVLIVKEYIDAESETEVNEVTDRLLPLMEEALCVNIVFNSELARVYGMKHEDRLEIIKEGELALIDQCKDEFEKNDLSDLVDELLDKLIEGGNDDGNSGDGSGDRK